MEIKIDAAELKHALSILSNVISNNSYLPILVDTLYVKVYENYIRLYGRDSDKYAVVHIVASCSAQDSFLIPFSRLYAVVSHLEKENHFLQLSILKNKLKITDESLSTVTFQVLSADGFPDIPAELAKVVFEVNQDDFANTTRMDAFTQSDKLLLTALHVSSDGTGLSVESTNSYSGGRVSIDKVGNSIFDVAILATASRAIRYALRGGNGNVTVTLNEKYCRVVGDTWEIGTQVLEQPYLNLKTLYNNSAVNKVELVVTDLLSALKIVQQMMTDHCLHLEFTGSELVISVKSEVGEVSRKLSVNDVQINNVIKVDILQLQKILSVLQDDVFTMQVGSKNEPVLFEDSSGKFFLMTLS